MSKNYSLIEIKSLLENIQDQIFSILLDSSPNSNRGYFQNFTGIALKTIKYLNHYINVLKHDEEIGSFLAYIFKNLQCSFDEYKSRNIYFQSCLSSPLAQNQDEQKQQDQIYHFMNTRNKDLPLQILGNPDYQRQRMELALFIEKMSKKKVTLREPKRSLRMPQQHMNELKILRKATYDPSLHPLPSQNQINPAQEYNMKETQQVQVQTQTDYLLNEYETKTQKQQDDMKSQAQSCLKSEIAVATVQNIQYSVKKKNKATIKNKKNLKGTDLKGGQKKKKALIASSVKQNHHSQSPSSKSIKKYNKNQVSSEKNIKFKRQCNIEALCTQRDTIKLNSKQVNVIYSKDWFEIFQNQIEEKQTLSENQNKQIQVNKIQEVKSKDAIEITRNRIMEVIAETMDEQNHPYLKSDASCRSQMLNDQIVSKINQGSENRKPNNLAKKNNILLNRNQNRKSHIVPTASIKIDQEVDLVNTKKQNQKDFTKKIGGKSSNPNKRWIQLDTNKNQIIENQSILIQQNDKLKPREQFCINEGRKSVQVNKEQNEMNKEKLTKQILSQNIQDSHLAPIKQTTTNNNERFSKLNVRKSRMEHMPRRLKNKFVHSTGYLDKYINKDEIKNKYDNQFEGRSSAKKGSLIIINNRNKIIENKSEFNNKLRESFSAKQHISSNNTKVKLANLFKIQNGQIQNQKPQKYKNNNKNDSVEKKVLNMSYDGYQSLKSSGVKLNNEDKETKVCNAILRNKKIAQSLYNDNNQSQYNLIARQLRHNYKRQLIRQYLDLIQTSHKKFCGQKCVHIENLYKKTNFDGTKSEQDIIEQLLRLIRKGK